MAGRGIRLFTDEHVHATLAVVLRQRGYDVITCQEAGMSNADDEPLLEYATREGRAILTNNFADFNRLDHAWKAAGRQHAGIILYPQARTFSALLQHIQQHLDTTDPQVQYDTLIWA